MTAKQLIIELEKLPSQVRATAHVSMIWDGASRSSVEEVWLSKNGEVCLHDGEHVVYADGDRPSNAPSVKTKQYWKGTAHA